MADQAAATRIHVSTHPIVRAKLSQLRSKSCDARSTNRLIHEIASIISCEALASCLKVTSTGRDETPMGYAYDIETITPSRISVVPILRSGLGMVAAIRDLLPEYVSVHHLGLFREPISLQPVEYYNNLPYHDSPTTTTDEHLAIILDPIIATGGTVAAAIQTLKEWGISRIVTISILGSQVGVNKAVEEWDQVEVWIAGVDNQVNDKGMIVPGVGDIGDRLFGTKGK